MKKIFAFTSMILVLIILSGAEAWGQKTTTWNTTSGGQWTDASNWTNGVPVVGDDVIISSDQTAPITNHPTISLRSLIINGNCNLQSSAGLLQSSLITVTGTFSVNAGKTLSLGNQGMPLFYMSDFTLDANASGTIGGTLNVYSFFCRIDVLGNLTILNTGLITGNSANYIVFSLGSGATLQVANVDGITTSGATGAIQVPVRSYYAGANYVYNGTSAQITGLGLTQNTPANLTINNSSGVTLSTTTSISGLLTIASGTLNIANTSLSVGSLTGSGNISNLSGTSGTPTITIGGDNTSPAPYIGVISNGTATSVAITKNGTGTLTLSGANSYTGLTTVNAGTLKIGSAGGTTDTPLGTNGAGTTVSSDAVLDLNGFTLGTAEALTLNGTGISYGGALINSSATAISYSGAITLTSGSSIGTLGNITSSGVISGANSLTKVGSGTLILSGDNTFSGGLTISAGTVQLGAADRIATQAVTINGGTFSTGATTGYKETIGTLALTDNSTIALGTGRHDLNFASSSSITWTSGKVLTITGWNGTPGTGNPGTEGRVIFGSTSTDLSTTQLGQIIFLIGGAYYSAQIRSNGEVVPTSSIFSITTGTISGSPFCAGASVPVPFTIAGTFIPGNVFTAELSDASGSFDSPVAIGSSTQTSAETITAAIPTGTANGTGYRIRVISSTPPVIGESNTSDLTVNASVGGTATAANSIMCSGSSTIINLTGYLGNIQWQQSNNGTEWVNVTGGAGETTEAYTTPELTTTIFYRAVVTNGGCTPANSTIAQVLVNVADVWSGGVSTEWNLAANWCGGLVPSSASSPIIPSTNVLNNPTITTAVTIEGLLIQSGRTLIVGSGGSLTATSVINAGNVIFESNTSAGTINTFTNIGTLTIDPLGKATITNLENNGILNLNSLEDGIGSLKLDSYTGNAANIKLYLTGYGDDTWHYISSPVQSLSTGIFTSVTSDLAHFVESLPASGELPYNWQRGWVASDGWSYETGDYEGYAGFTTLDPGKGYNYWHTSDQMYDFSGNINTSDPAPLLAYSGDPDWSGYNLLGNPFTCGLDIDYMFANVWPSSASQAVWFTNNGESYVYGSGVGVPVNEEEGFIPPMQGFFVRTTASGSFNFPLGARVHTSVPRYKGDRSSIPLVRLSISANGNSEETVVRFDEKAKAELDLIFDAPRFISNSNSPSIYTSLDGTDYTINGLPFPESSVEIPVTVKLLTEGNHTITAMELQELGNYIVTLTDKSSNSTIDLKSVKEYKFSASAGLIKDRFILTITSISTGTVEPVIDESLFNIYQGFGLINIQPLADEWDGKTGSIKVMDLSGKAVRLQQKTEFRKNTLIQLPSPETNGLYFIEIRSGLMRHIGKVIIK